MAPDIDETEETVETDETTEGDSPVSVRDALERAYAEAEEPSEDSDSSPESLSTPEESTPDLNQSQELGAEPDAVPAIVAPYSWSKEAKELFSKVPTKPKEVAAWGKKVQQHFQNRDADREKYLTSRSEEVARERDELGKERSKYGTFDRVFNKDVQGWLGEKGWIPETFISAALSFEGQLRKNPTQAILGLCQRIGVNPQVLTSPQARQARLHPQIENYLKQQAQEIKGLKTKQTAREQQERQSEKTYYDREIQGFFEATNETGELQHPHLSEIYPLMVPLVQKSLKERPGQPVQAVLKEAYDQAVWAHPDARTKMLESTSQQKRQETAQRVQSAQQASSSVSGGPNGAASPQPKSIRDALLQSWEDTRGG